MTLVADGTTAILKLVVGIESRELIRAGEEVMRREGFKRRRYLHNGEWQEKEL